MKIWWLSLIIAFITIILVMIIDKFVFQNYYSTGYYNILCFLMWILLNQFFDFELKRKNKK